ncbi:hypothetical protein [Legionella pneumophila]|nr:hypothetical protein [Legionella pneumophila]
MRIVLFNQFICPVFGLVLIERFTQRGYPACAARLEMVGQIKVNDYFGTTVFLVVYLLIVEIQKRTAIQQQLPLIHG